MTYISFIHVTETEGNIHAKFGKSVTELHSSPLQW